MYIKVILSKYLNLNRWPKSGPLALNGVLLVAQKWPVGKQEVNARFNFLAVPSVLFGYPWPDSKLELIKHCGLILRRFLKESPSSSRNSVP